MQRPLASLVTFAIQAAISICDLKKKQWFNCSNVCQECAIGTKAYMDSIKNCDLHSLMKSSGRGMGSAKRKCNKAVTET